MRLLFVSREGARAGIWRYRMDESGAVLDERPQFWPTRILSPICFAMGEEKTVIGLQRGGIILEKTETFFAEKADKEFKTIHSLQDVQDIGSIVIVKRSEVF